MGEDDKYTKKDIERARWEGVTTHQLADISIAVKSVDDKLDKKADLIDFVNLQTEFSKMNERIAGLEKKVYIGIGALAVIQVVISMVPFLWNVLAHG